MAQALSLRELIIQFQGREPPLESDAPERAEKLLPDPGIGYSQFNEVLLLLGYDRVSASFFQFLIDGSSTYIPGSAFTGLGRISKGIERFRIYAMWFYGNFRFALRRMASEDSTDLDELIPRITPLDESPFESRHAPVRDIETIEPKDTYFLGYIVDGEVEARLAANPRDPAALQAKNQMNDIRVVGRRNHDSYLTWDHMDVYVATSMRENHQYYSISRTTNEIFGSDKLTALKLRWFDPTQAFCESRLDKGLSEALMLKRADCTLYLVQETDSFGKDSELASTLAQGKVVIAYVPIAESKEVFIEELRAMHGDLCPEQPWPDVLRDQLRQFNPSVAWSDPEIRKWLDEPDLLSEPEIEQKLFDVAKGVYDKRALILQETHPLGLQVNLDTGVAVGVLVARTVEQCVNLIHATITQRLAFRIDQDESGTLLLRESISGSVARVVSGDPLLTNSFWNFYPR